MPRARAGRPGPGWPRLVRGAALAAALLPAGAACGGDEPPPQLVDQGAPPPEPGRASAPSTPRDTTPRVRNVFVVQLGAFADSTAAARLRDSLAAAGWEAYVRQVPGDTLPPWRVRLNPTLERPTADALLAGFAAAGRPAFLVADAIERGPERILVHRVSNGAFGMAARVRWTLAPDRRALIVVEDGTAVENDPLPDGFLYAAERGPVLMQRDNVWHVAPNPGWSRVAYGKAYMISAAGRDSLSIRQWMGVAAQTSLDVAVVRRAAFPVSGMSVIMGFAQPVVEPLHPDSAETSALRRAVTQVVPVPGGWRVRWSADGRTLAVGLPPERQVRDDAPPAGWLEVDARSFLVRGELQSYARMATVDWVEGPVLDVSVPFDASPRRLPVEGGAVESRDGWILLQGAVTRGRRRILGPGVPLAVTAGGRFVVAVAPTLAPRPGDPRVRTVVYELRP